MPPNTSFPSGVLDAQAQDVPAETQKPEKRKLQLVWRNIILFAYLHLAALYGIWLMFTSAKLVTSIVSIFLYQLGGFGITAGAHRLWAHRSYKAKWPLRLILTFCNTLAFEDSVIDWARDHRVHHKYSETDADPHNATRGFFFSHIGWLLCRKHPQVKEKGKQIDLSDLYADPILRYQKKYYFVLMPLVCFVMPTVIPMYLWNETFKNAFFLNLFRYTLTLNGSWLVNSAAHMWGHKPYDRFINPAENLVVSVLALGEGWHNYHHTFPWDYKTAELGKYSVNFSAAFIDFFAKIGWAYDLKTVSEEMIKKRAERTGDGSHEIWGWGDKDQPLEDYKDAIIKHRKGSKIREAGVLDVQAQNLPAEVQNPEQPKLRLVWRNIIAFAFLHMSALYGIWLIFTSAKLVTSIVSLFLIQLGGLGVSAGAHRLWAHRSYKAKRPLRLILTFFNTLAFEDCVIDWARDHRVHHKYTETDADPHNPTRGFFFSHIGWLLCRKHPQVKEKGKQVDLSDLYADPILRYQKKYYLVLMPLVCFVMPTLLPVCLWNETLENAFFLNLLRYALTLNGSWMVNSVAHRWGGKPYDRFINPSDNLVVSAISLGEGWHNYHHTFPWDYRSTELGKYGLNLTGTVIDLFAKIGWAYDLKTASEKMIRKRVQRTGDGSHEIWGWGDKDQPLEDYKDAIIKHGKGSKVVL